MSDSFDLGEPARPAAIVPYRVLARKYRPQRFSELIGQDAMVTTLGNAIKRDRIAHAFLMTGVRGVGKTSTARLIAKALNCEHGPTIDPCGACDACVAIAEGRHIDVIEMDAASHTGVDDVREIIEAVRYSAVSARFKVYIIDEVHMLSRNAFNALLKTLEEPPPHVKFLFATTEVQKLPVTVLSRCQRFDLRRISSDMLARHFAAIVKAEGVMADDEALALIARASEGSVRDGLSILDQAIAHAGMEDVEVVTAAQVRDMLGLSDRGAVRHLFGLLLSGQSVAALAALQEQCDLGVEPVAVVRALLDITHGTTLAKVGAAPDPAQSAEERDALLEWAKALSFAMLHRLWQMLLKGHDEVARAAEPAEAADMVLLRIIYASQLPDPGEFIQKLENGTATATAVVPGSVDTPSTPSPVNQSSLAQDTMPADFTAMILLVEAAGHNILGYQLREEVGLVSYAPPALVIQPHRPFDIKALATVLKDVTGTVWQIATAEAPEAPLTLQQQEEAGARAERDGVLAQPVVQAALAAFPGADLIDYSLTDKRSAHA